METVAVAPARHQPTGKFINDNDLAIFNHIIYVTPEQKVSFERLIDSMNQVHIVEIIKIGYIKVFFSFGYAVFIQADCSGFLIKNKMLVFLQAADKIVNTIIKLS